MPETEISFEELKSHLKLYVVFFVAAEAARSFREKPSTVLSRAKTTSKGLTIKLLLSLLSFESV